MNTIAQLPDDDQKNQEIINIADAEAESSDLNEAGAVSIDDQPVIVSESLDEDMKKALDSQKNSQKIVNDAGKVVKTNQAQTTDAANNKTKLEEKSTKNTLPHVAPLQVKPTAGYGTKTNNATSSYVDNSRSLGGRSVSPTTIRSAQSSLNLNRVNTTRTQADSSKLVPISGVLDLSLQGHGVIRVGYSEDDNDAYISTALIRRYNLLQGDIVTGTAREPKENDRYYGFAQIETVNDIPLADWGKTARQKFHRLTPVYPDDQIQLEIGEEPLSLRIIDLIAPIGKGQRSLIVSPPKAGKTILLKDIATGIARNHPEIHLMAVLVGERPEEVTDIRRHIEQLTQRKGEVAASNFDEHAKDQCRVAELALERAKRLVELGHDVVILLDSITRLARAYNLAMPTSGRTLSGGFDPAALFPPKKFFGAARNFEVKGSLTIVGTALVETGSRMDDLIYEEFKGTGNQEVHLTRRLAERRIYPAIEVQKSGTRRDDLLMNSQTYQSIITLQRMLDMIDANDRTTTLIDQLKKHKSNKEFLASLKQG